MSQPSLKSPSSQQPGHFFKEVRFSHPLVPVRRARSVASGNPYLDSAYHAARVAKKASTEPTYKDFAVYIDQSQSVLESQRVHFERERLLFAEERKLWEIERSLLKSRIAELEKAAGGNNAQPYMSQFRPSFSLKGGGPNKMFNAGRDASPGQHHVWEGPLTGSRRPTRVFPGEDDSDMNTTLYLAPTEANGFGFCTSLDAALSPQLFDRTGHISMPVPIEKVDSELDGITLKSTALPPDVVAKVMTPPTSISPTSSPPKDEPDTSKSALEGKSPLKLSLSDLGPLDVRLTRDAGHTPMAILGTETEASYQSPNEVTLHQTEMEEEEAPLAPVVTKQPVESGDSYFPVIVDEDPALKGPLTLENDENADSAFLLQLDQKLLDEAKKAIGGSFALDEEKVDSEDDTAGGNNDDEPDPELKLKPSTNFGTAFGQC
ncbi:conserved hypothetical protein [Talaromyces stipitatus ATCC 10500]|uniref:Uncharacterized protein n=1 Tax=Talaromyces stipitatus (strain ATCC 10500 / CBS 375.48 / QM 6759 / NRRL 1006) TaxID=441959 RepID=B8M9V1_TALSN|nr:uncharacterized protein TSTA_118690 [Talaromyces stipitatus ATCC 10500]EED18103.1 conserved hypothetical protein [Talaromyces stipitatus ATCC 10500]